MDNGRELGWNEVIKNDSPNFVVLPEGDYDFKIIEIEKTRHNGSEKLPPCYKAIVYLKIEIQEGISVIKHNLFLHSKTERMLCTFFIAIGQRKKNEQFAMNWNTVVGARGRAKIGIEKWINAEGREVVTNKIVRFYEPDSTVPQKEKNYEPGRF